MNKLNKALVGAFVVVTTMFVGAGVASADAASITTALVNTGSSEIESVIPLVAAGFIGIAAAMFAVRWVYRVVRGGGRA